MNLCRRCGEVPLNSNHEWYCPTCRAIVKKEIQHRQNEQRKANRRAKRGAYHYKKNEGIENPAPKARRSFSSPASKRWASMSWEDLTKELLYYRMNYPESQIRAEKNTLPEDFGKKRKAVRG